jgi:hypothetical protein
MLFQEIISQTVKLKKLEFFKQEEIFIKVVSKEKTETQFMVHLEYNQENYLFQDPLETLKLNIQNLEAIQKY